ncbi:RagB/SusD family nutrient uptake outer membrane protein [Chitinophaga lutea]
MKDRCLLLFITCLMIACQKQKDWLNEKRQVDDISSESLIDLQAIMDNSLLVTAFPSIGLAGCDNFYFQDQTIQTLSFTERNAYQWNKEIYGNSHAMDYAEAYFTISYCNIVLEGLSKIRITQDNELTYYDVMGQALFLRAMVFHELAVTYCKAYQKSNAGSDLGLCLRLTSEITHIEPRSSLEQTYTQIVKDIKLSINLLPRVPKYKTRGSRSAAHALLSRVYLNQQDYSNALRHADTAISMSNGLLDFNSPIVSLSKVYRFPSFSEDNPEVMFYATGIAYYSVWCGVSNVYGCVDSTLFQSYSDNDLRRTYFFSTEDSDKRFRGSYSSAERCFAGIAVNEVYFNRAECYARLGNIGLALADLNNVMKRRFRSGTYADYSSTDQDSVLNTILRERRKEFPNTGQIRWMDLKRLNLEPKFAKELTRTINGTVYRLPPNSQLYVYPLPKAEIVAGIRQNER